MALQTGEIIDHYRVLDCLGSGGMADVYRAEDLRLRRLVALKTLRTGDGIEDATARLLAEARAASALNHPHIAVVYEIGKVEHGAESLAYIAMEFVEGTTLATMAQSGPLDLDTILDIFEQIADALAEAERLGIVHRDLKPANVMVTAAGRVKVLDFGVAQRRRPAAVAADDSTKTADLPDFGSGFSGTLGYAAPEQLAGRDVDVRADLFSLGVMLYELVCGRRPFTGNGVAQVLESILTKEVPPFPDPNRDARLPVLERFVRRLLARDRDDRPATAADLRATFQSIRTSVGAPAAPARDLGSILVIAGFRNISGNPDDEWLAAGIAETLTMDAAQIETVTVIPRDRVEDALRTLRHQTHEPDERLYIRAARALGARWVVTGGFQRSADAVRVTASLTDVATGEIGRTTRVDGRVDAIFELQDRLVRELAGSLRAAVTPATAETDVISAYEAFSRGLLNRQAETFEALDRSVILFERAVALDPAYGRAHVELGAALRDKADYLSMPELYGRALANLRRGVELQPGVTRAWRELGADLLSLGQNAEAVAALERALALDPEDVNSLGSMGRALFIGYARFREAAEWFDRAVERNASAGWYWLQLAHCAALLRELERGERAAARAVALQEAALSGRQGLLIAGGYMRSGHLSALRGRHAEAVNLYQREIDFLQRTEHPLRHRIVVELNARLGAAHQQLGNAEQANALFETALENFEHRVRLGADEPFTRYYAAAIHALRGEAEPALAFLERAVALQPAFTIARAAIEPEFESLRPDPRFQRLVQPNRS